jgi:hypothetical protein
MIGWSGTSCTELEQAENDFLYGFDSVPNNDR